MNFYASSDVIHINIWIVFDGTIETKVLNVYYIERGPEFWTFFVLIFPVNFRVSLWGLKFDMCVAKWMSTNSDRYAFRLNCNTIYIDMSLLFSDILFEIAIARDRNHWSVSIIDVHIHTHIYIYIFLNQSCESYQVMTRSYI